MRDERTGEGRPSGLMRGAETRAGLAVKVFVKEDRISPRRILLEAEICSVRGTPAVRIKHKEAQKPPLEFACDLLQVCLPARSGRQLDSKIVPEEVVKVAQRLDGE
ncbi:MAG TPA: hypothetical protein VLI91_09440, partial [Roseiarcus sp.]|nr:hypothetical protein [Roseiarcus sp.]